MMIKCDRITKIYQSGENEVPVLKNVSFEIEKGEQDKNGLKGQSAYKGKVSGVVRIVKRTDQAAGRVARPRYADLQA